jgi:hypothetical protein
VKTPSLIHYWYLTVLIYSNSRNTNYWTPCYTGRFQNFTGNLEDYVQSIFFGLSIMKMNTWFKLIGSGFFLQLWNPSFRMLILRCRQNYYKQNTAPLKFRQFAWQPLKICTSRAQFENTAGCTVVTDCIARHSRTFESWNTGMVGVDAA